MLFMTSDFSKILILAACVSAVPSLGAAQSARTVTDETKGWQFLRGDAENAQAINFDTRAWQNVALPHTYNADLTNGKTTEYYRGKAWYRRAIKLHAIKAGERRFLEFDGAALTADVWINGVKVGTHKGGFSRFRFDVTPFLHAGTNVLAVCVDNARQADVAPRGGDFTVFGGLYRPVRLVTTHAVHFDMLDYGGPGVHVTGKDVTADAATIQWHARVRNDGATAVSTKVTVRLLDAQKNLVREITQAVAVPPDTTVPVDLTTRIDHPHLWNGVADPYLYSTQAVVTTESGALLDTQTVVTGLRDIRIDPDRGLLLNGKPYGVHGVDIHQTMLPGLGSAVADAAVDEDFSILSEMGVTGLRLAHYQHPQRDYDLSDKLGFLVWTEIPLNGEVDPSPGFEANVADQLRELIRQNDNHPSVMVWGLGNEIYKSDEVSNRILDHMQEIAHAEDTSRPTAYANCCGPVTQPHAMHTDLLGANVYFGWYSGEFSDLDTWAAESHTLMSNRPLAVSEYGAGGSVLQQEDPPKRPQTGGRWHPEQYETLYHEAAWRTLGRLNYLWGSFVWVGFDFPSTGRNEGDTPGYNDKGLVTFDRKTRKDAYFWYQANWAQKPMVYITSRRDTERKTATVTVKVYSNQPTVSLRLNNAELGVHDVVDHIATWQVTLSAGNNTLVATAGKQRDKVTWNLSN